MGLMLKPYARGSDMDRLYSQAARSNVDNFVMVKVSKKHPKSIHEVILYTEGGSKYEIFNVRTLKALERRGMMKRGAEEPNLSASDPEYTWWYYEVV